MVESLIATMSWFYLVCNRVQDFHYIFNFNLKLKMYLAILWKINSNQNTEFFQLVITVTLLITSVDKKFHRDFFSSKLVLSIIGLVFPSSTKTPCIDCTDIKNWRRKMLQSVDYFNNYYSDLAKLYI